MRRWPEIVGPILAKHSHPERYDRGTLWIAASGSAWAQELRLGQELILGRLNEAVGETLFTGIRVGVRPG
jgi:predicted nucleic acid-binding Zn ribbon protein